MSVQGAEGLAGDAPLQERFTKHVSKVRFIRHAKTMYEESEKTRVYLDRLTAATEAAASKAEAWAQNASDERRKYAVKVEGLLERIVGDLADVMRAVHDLPPAGVGGSAGTPAAIVGTMNGVGSSSGCAVSASSADASGHPKRSRKAWAGASRRAHWILVGAPPIILTKHTTQNILGDTTKVTPKVNTMLTTLDNIDVSVFSRPHSHLPPLATRTTIMCQAIVSLADKSIPVPDGAPANIERQLCRARVHELATALAVGSNLLEAASKRCRWAVTQPKMMETLSSLVNADMATWTRALHEKAASLERALPGPPGSVRDLGDLCLPKWPLLKAFLSSGALDLANIPPASSRGHHEPKSSTSALCLLHLENLCTNGDACRYSHGPKGASSSGGGSNSGEGSGAKRRQPGATTTAPKRKKRDKEGQKGGQKRRRHQWGGQR